MSPQLFLVQLSCVQQYLGAILVTIGVVNCKLYVYVKLTIVVNFKYFTVAFIPCLSTWKLLSNY